MKLAKQATLVALLAISFAVVRGTEATEEQASHLRRNPLPKGSRDAVNSKKGSLKPRKLNDDNRARSRAVGVAPCGGKDGGYMGNGKYGGKDGGYMGNGKYGGKDGGYMRNGKDGGDMGYGKAGGKGGRRHLHCVCPDGSSPPCYIEGDPLDDPITRINDLPEGEQIPLHDDSKLGLTGSDEDEDEPSGEFTGSDGGEGAPNSGNGGNSIGIGGDGAGNVILPDSLPVVAPGNNGNGGFNNGNNGNGGNGQGDSIEEETSNEDIDIGLNYAKYVPSNDSNEAEYDGDTQATNKALNMDTESIPFTPPAGPPSNDGW